MPDRIATARQSGELTEADYLWLKRKHIREDCDAAVGRAANAYRQALLRSLIPTSEAE